MQQYTAIEVPRQIASPKVIILKAVHKASGEIVGWVSFALRGFEQEEVAALDPASKFGDQGGLLPVSNSAPSEQPDVKEASFPDSETGKESHLEDEDGKQEKEEDDSIKRFKELTNADLPKWPEHHHAGRNKVHLRCVTLCGTQVADTKESDRHS